MRKMMFLALSFSALLLSACAPVLKSEQQLQVSAPRSAACTSTSSGAPINGLSLSNSFGGSFGIDLMDRLRAELMKVGFRTDLDAVDHAQIQIFGTVEAWKNLYGDQPGRVGAVDLTVSDTRTGLPLLAIHSQAAGTISQAPTAKQFTAQLLTVLMTQFCQQV